MSAKEIIKLFSLQLIISLHSFLRMSNFWVKAELGVHILIFGDFNLKTFLARS